MRVRAFVPLLFILAVVPATASDFDIAGRFVGYGYVYRSGGESVRTDIRMDLRENTNGGYVLELNYLDGRTAKLNALKKENAYTLSIDETVSAGQTSKAAVRGRVFSMNGSKISGTIEIREQGKAAGAKPSATIRFLAERLRERPAPAE